MIQTLEAEIDEKGAVRLARPAHFDRKHRVLVMVIPDQSYGEGDDTPDDWNQPYRYLPSLS